MKVKQNDTEKVENLLKQLPEIEPPPAIVNNVMERLRPTKKPLWQRVINYLATPKQFTLQPMRLVATSLVVGAVFWLGMITGMERNTSTEQPQHFNIVEKVLHDNEASFLVGRGLMAAGLPNEALPLLQKASLSAPDNPEYAYWEGLCFWANGKPEKERSSYVRGINSSPDTLPLLINLGHNLLEQGELDAALAQYDKVLAIDPHERATLYNRGLIYRLKRDAYNETIAWKNYLKHHRFGEKSFRAVEHLNSLNDFTYRTYQLGNRKTILSQSSLLNILPTSEVNNQEVKILAHRLRSDPTLHIDIVVFHENATQTARKNAKLIKETIISILGEEGKERVRLSWFGEKETIKTPNGTHQLPESLLLFGRHNTTEAKETEI